MIVKLLDRLFVVAGAFLGSQIPGFMLQYKQHLAGYVDALQEMMDRLRQIAALSHKTFEQYLLKFKESGDADFVQQADFMQLIASRQTEFQEALSHLNAASPLARLYYFIMDFHVEVARSTWKSFAFGFTFNLEGLLFTLVGLFVGWGFFSSLRRLLRLTRH